MLEHSVSYVKDHLEGILKAGLPVRITRHGVTMGYYNPSKRMVNGVLEDIEKAQIKPSIAPFVPPEERAITLD